MDHTFSTTGAIRQHHQQSIRNSLSPSPHSNATTAHHLYRISPTPITNNILSAAAAISGGNYSHYGRNSPISAGTNLGSSSGGYPTSPQPTAVINPASVSNFYRVPTYSVQQQQQQTQVQVQQHHQQQHYIQQIQQQSQPQTCNFAGISSVVSANSPPQETSYSAQSGIHTRIATGQYPLRPNTTNNSSNIRISPTNQAISVTPYSTVSNGQSSYSSHQTENNYRNHQHQHHQQVLQQQQPHQYHQQQQQFSSAPASLNQQQYQNPLKSQQHNHPQQQQQTQMPNSHHQQQQNNMNKNRYMNQQQQLQQQPNLNGVVGVSTAQNSIGGAENGNTTTAANVKALIQQVSQQQQQQQNVNNNVNVSNSITATTPPSNNSNNGSSNQNPQQQPQYRIFKRGDSIPGISSPIQITPTVSSSSENGKGNHTNISSESGSGNNETGHSSSVLQADAQNDKENNRNLAQPTKNGGNNSGGSSTGNSSTGSRTPLSQIGEIAKFHNLSVEYRLVNETGPPHAPTFTVLLRVGNEEFNGQGASIKKAQHAAAVEALEKTTLSRPPPKNKANRKPFGIGGSVGGGNKRPNWNLIQLTALAQELQLPLQFVQQPVPIVDPFRRGDPPSIVSVHVGDKIFTGEGINFNAAKNTAVMVALKAMIKVKQEIDLAKMVQVGAEQEQSMMEAENKSPISIVHEMAMKRGLTVQFEILKEDGPPHMKVFTVKCKVGELETEGEGPTKQAAKKASSEQMIAKLKEIPITVPATSQGLNLKAMQRGFLKQKQQKKKTSIPVVKDLEKQAVSPISRLIQIAHTKKFKEPEFTLISTGTESNVENFLKQITERDRRMLRKKKPVFTIEVTVGPHTCRGTGPNKKAAKKAAAEAAVIALGYAPTEGASDEGTEACSVGDGNASDQVPTSPPAIIGGGKSSGKKSGGGGASSGQSDVGKSSGNGGGPTVKLAGARQIAPGIIVLKSENTTVGGTTSSAVAHEMKKVGSLMTPCPTASSREGIDKLAYLSKLLEISVSYSDFPKKNEYLSVVSLTTNPPHVAHGCGKTLEEAQNAAALKILEELSTMDLDSVTAAAEKTTE